MVILSYENINILEKVQHHAAKLIQSIAYLPYQDHLKTLHLPSFIVADSEEILLKLLKY